MNFRDPSITKGTHAKSQLGFRLSSDTLLRSFLFGCLFFTLSCSVGSSPSSSGSQPAFHKAVMEEELSRLGHESGDVASVSRSQYNFLLGELAFKHEKLKEALIYLELASQEETSPAPTLRRRLAQLYLRLGRLEDALSQIELAGAAAEKDLDLLQLKAGILATLKKNDEAIMAYRRIIDQSERLLEEPYVFIASIYAQDNNIDAAKGVLGELISKRPDSFFANYYSAKIYLAGGDFESAEKFYKEALEINPAADTAQVELARVYTHQKRFEEAIELCQKVVERNPANVKARGLLGELLLGRDRVDDALKEFEVIGSIEEDSSEARFKIALIKLQRRDFPGAEVELRLILSQHPENSAARYYLSSACAGMARVGEAIEQLRLIEPGQNFFVESRMLGAYLLRQAERYDEALELVNELLDQTPEDLKLLALKAAVQRSAKDLKGAIRTTEKIIGLAPAKDRHYFSLGVYHDELGDIDSSVAAMRKAIEINPNNANALNYLGYTLAERSKATQKDLEEAEKLILRAIEIEESNGYFIDSLGWVYFKMGRYADAVRELDRATSIVSDDSVVLEHLARANLKMGDVSRAQEILEKAIEYAPKLEDEKIKERLEKLLESIAESQ